VRKVEVCGQNPLAREENFRAFYPEHQAVPRKDDFRIFRHLLQNDYDHGNSIKRF